MGIWAKRAGKWKIHVKDHGLVGFPSPSCCCTDPCCCKATGPDMALSSSAGQDFTHNKLLLSSLVPPGSPPFTIPTRFHFSFSPICSLHAGTLYLLPLKVGHAGGWLLGDLHCSCLVVAKGSPQSTHVAWRWAGLWLSSPTTLCGLEAGGLCVCIAHTP